MKLLFFVSLILLASCGAPTIPDVKPGEIKHIPYSSLYAVGTDSAIVIMARDSGRITDIIYRFK